MRRQFGMEPGKLATARVFAACRMRDDERSSILGMRDAMARSRRLYNCARLLHVIGFSHSSDTHQHLPSRAATCTQARPSRILRRVGYRRRLIRLTQRTCPHKRSFETAELGELLSSLRMSIRGERFTSGECAENLAGFWRTERPPSSSRRLRSQRIGRVFGLGDSFRPLIGAGSLPGPS